MNTHRLSAIMLLSLLGSTAAIAQPGAAKPADVQATARTGPDPAAAPPELDPRSHSYGLYARHHIRSTKTRDEVRAELMEARAARLRHERRSED